MGERKNLQKKERLTHGIPQKIFTKVLKDGTADIEEKYLKVIAECASDYTDKIMRKLREYGYNKELAKLHFLGGGAMLMKHFKLTEKTAKILAEYSKAENMNESEYIRYLILNQKVKNNNSHLYRESDKINLIRYVEEINELLKELVMMFMTG